MLSLYERYVPLTDIVPRPTLERTQAEIRDRAVSDANELRQENAELRRALRVWLDFAGVKFSEFDLEVCESDNLCRQCEEDGCINLKIRTTRALLTKVSR